MTTYVIGDVQGCWASLDALLDRIAFDTTCDQLWFTGDLVNRGPDSARVVRFVQALGERATVVLGNHDLHLLAVADGAARLRREDTFTDVLTAADAPELLGWLRQQPLAVYDPIRAVLLVHAAIAPIWSLDDALRAAAEVEQALRDPGCPAWLAEMYGNDPKRIDNGTKRTERLRYYTNIFTRTRYLDSLGQPDFSENRSPQAARNGLQPWFRVPRRTADLHIIFGHWSTLGYHVENKTTCVDSGCLWGGQLTALALDRVGTGSPTHLPCPCYLIPQTA